MGTVPIFSDAPIFADPVVLWRKAGVRPAALEALARADAYRSMGLDRREALWAVKGLPAEPLPLFAAAGEEERGEEPAAALPEMAPGEHVVDDYRSLRLSLKAHPVSFLRAGLARDGMVPAEALAHLPDGTGLKVAGLVLVRQRPGSASGVIFATLEDETGVANVVVWPDVFERYRTAVLKASLLAVEGRLQREGLVIHVVAQRLVDLSERLGELSRPPGEAAAPPFDNAPARADEATRPGRDARPLVRSRDFH
jgi:error-prone DNA polymerase